MKTKDMKVFIFFFIAIFKAQADQLSDIERLQKCVKAPLSAEFEACWNKCQLPLPPSTYFKSESKFSFDDRDKYSDCLELNKCSDLDDQARTTQCTHTFLRNARDCENPKREKSKKDAACALANRHKDNIGLFLERDMQNCSIGFSTPVVILETLSIMKDDMPDNYKESFNASSHSALEVSFGNLLKYSGFCAKCA